MTERTEEITCRRAQDDDVPALRRLINAAYRPLGEIGLNYTGTYQDEEITRQRMDGREVYVLEAAGTILGTVSLDIRPGSHAGCAYIDQLAVERPCWVA